MTRLMSLILALSFIMAHALLSQVKTATEPICKLIATGKREPLKILPPQAVLDLVRAVQEVRNNKVGARSTLSLVSFNISINYIGDWPPEARNALQYACDIWSAYLNMPQSVVIDATWDDSLASNTLGSCGATGWYHVPSDSFLRPTALAEAITNSNLNGNNAEIAMSINPNHQWYFGTDGNPGEDQYDFVTTALHEICHGLGFAGSMNINSTTGEATHGSPPNIYDMFTIGGPSSTHLIDLSQGELQYYLTHDTKFSGWWQNEGRFRDGYGTGPAELYAPVTWTPGSSYSHLDENWNGTPADLMTYSGGTQHAVHSPGYMIRGMMYNFSWLTHTSMSGTITGTRTDPFGIRLVPGTSVTPSSGTVQLLIQTF